MSRRYHRHVGGKVPTHTPSTPRMQAEPDGYFGGVTGPERIPAHCCPDVPPWERCEHQAMRKVLREMAR